MSYWKTSPMLEAEVQWIRSVDHPRERGAVRVQSRTTACPDACVGSCVCFFSRTIQGVEASEVSNLPRGRPE